MAVWHVDTIIGKILALAGGRIGALTFGQVELGVTEGGGVKDFVCVELGESLADDHGTLGIAAKDEFSLWAFGGGFGEVVF